MAYTNVFDREARNRQKSYLTEQVDLLKKVDEEQRIKEFNRQKNLKSIGIQKFLDLAVAKQSGTAFGQAEAVRVASRLTPTNFLDLLEKGQTEVDAGYIPRRGGGGTRVEEEEVFKNILLQFLKNGQKKKASS